MPDSITFISTSAPFSIIGVRTAPIPSPRTSKFGGELYPLPEELIKTSVILPPDTIGVTCVPEPLRSLIVGCLL